MKIVETKSQLDKFLKLYNKHDSIILPVMADADLHPLNTRIAELNHLRDSNQTEESEVEKKLISLQSIFKGQQDELDKYRKQLTD